MNLYPSLFSITMSQLPLHVTLEQVRLEGLPWVSLSSCLPMHENIMASSHKF